MTTVETFLSGRVSLWHGDCREVLRSLKSDCMDSVVCDPPYHLSAIVKRFGGKSAAPAKSGKTGAFARQSKGFMGKQWDGGDIAFRSETWAEVLRVLKPGGYLLAFASSRGFGRMSVAIEDAGFISHPLIAWIFGSGFPKAHKVDAEGYEGFRYGGQALKPAIEPIYMGQKPFSEANGTANVLQHGTGALNIDGCRVQPTSESLRGGGDKGSMTCHEGWDRPWKRDPEAVAGHMAKRAANADRSEKLGRWPANVIHDGSDEVLAAFPESVGQQGDVRGDEPSSLTNNCYGKFNGRPATVARKDSGSAARFFYSAKADSDDRVGSKHPTVKPVDLMRYLCRLVTPPGGMILDPFAGTGTTGEAAFYEGFNATLIEREAEYIADIRRRMKLCLAGPQERAREIIKAKGEVKPLSGGLFDEAVA